MVRSGNYYLFETDSEEEEERPDEPIPDRSAFQVGGAWGVSQGCRSRVRCCRRFMVPW